MIARAEIGKYGKLDLWTALRRALLVLATLTLCYVAFRITLWLLSGKWPTSTSWHLLAFASAAYLAGHAIRVLRLALLVGGWRAGFRDLASFHFMTSAVGLALPMKLGEVYRVIELSSLAGGFLRSLMIIWCIRVFDTLVILLMLTFALSHIAEPASQFAAVTVAAVLFVAVTAVVIFIVPDNLRRLAVLIIRRYDKPATVPVLRVIERLRQSIRQAPTLLHGKIASLATLTMLIWICELGAFALAMPASSAGLNATLDALLSFLSEVTRGETILTILQEGRDDALGAQILAYLCATQIPLALLGLAASAYYLKLRFRSCS